MRRASWVVLLLSFALSVCASLLAQKITGTITGVVTDPQGAVVTGAEVTVKNQGTGATRTATTNAAGVYVVPDLPAGTYEVRVKAPNFKEFISKNVELNVSSTSTVNAALVLGSAGEQVTVEGTAIQVETTNGASGTVVTGQQVRELPLNGNNFIELTQLVPGVSALSSFNVVKKGLEGGVDFSVNGNTVTGNLFLIDGVNNNDIGSNRTILLYPSTQAIDEFKILRNSYGAEYGQAAGAIINIVTRGGTNQWHGGVSYYGRNTVLNAADYFTKRVHSVNPLSAAKDPVRRNDYLFNIAGPIVKDKLFFFVSEEWNREVRGQTRIGGVPTLAERGGDFSNTRGGTCDPSVSPAYSNGTNTGIPTFTGNVIPAANLSPAGLIFLANFPLPNLATPVGCSNWAQSFGDIDNWREDNVRSDFHITKTTSLMFRYTRDTWDQPFPSTLQYWGEDIWPNVEDHWAQPSSQATVKLTKLLGSSAVNDFQISFAANAINVARVGTGAPAGSYYSSPGTLGAALTANELNGANVAASPTYFPASLKAYKPGTSPTSLGQQGFWGNGPVGISCASPVCGTFGDEGPWHNNEQLLILKDDFSKVFRGHTFKAGFLATNNQKNQRLQNESLGENAQYWSTTADGWGGPPSSGNGVFDILNIGTQWGFSENSTNLFELMRWHDYEFYVGDNWKVRRNFTVDYGVRWSFLRNAYDANGNFGWFEPNLFNPSLGGSPCNGMLLTKHGLDTCATIGLAGGTLGHDTGLVPNNNHLIQPRIGIAWDVRGDGKTAIRAGFGTFYNRFMLNTAMAAPSNPPYVFTNPSSASQRSLDPQFAPVFPCASLCAAGLMGDKPGIGILQNDRIPEAIQYNLTVERELAPNTKLEIAYVGNQGRFLESFVNANMPITPAGRLAYAESSFGGNQNQNLTPFGAATGGAWGAIQFGGFNGVSHYDSLQALFRTRIKVVDAQFAYTWSKSLANTDISDSSGSRQQPNTYNAGDPRSFYGPSIINRPHIFVSSIVYNAPKLEGQNAFLRAVLGAWETSAILQYQSGPSLTVYSNTGNDLLGDGYANSNRPNLVTGQSCKPGNSAQNQWFNPAKFTMDKYVLGTLPTSGRGVCPGPGTANTDFSVRKNFKITERVNAKFSMDFFNLFNKTQFRADSVNVNLSNGGGLTACNFTVNTGASTACPGYPNDSVAWNPATSLNANFGQATNDRGPRQIQYGLKIEF